ncbi:hypothetical protein ABID23_000966 [Bartonella silvatica]|uniref:Uncharacterized protein n=1 Tax=Bartonella silvatica TaxID=357760 RepID=A0ABV2HHA6_9HYPH
MNIRYFFMASAITSVLTLALQESDRIVNKKPSPIVAPYTAHESDLHNHGSVSGALDTLNILETDSKSGVQQTEIND